MTLMFFFSLSMEPGHADFKGFLDVSTRGYTRLSIPFPLATSASPILLPASLVMIGRIGWQDPFGVCRPNVIAPQHLSGLLCSSSWTVGVHDRLGSKVPIPPGSSSVPRPFALKAMTSQP